MKIGILGDVHAKWNEAELTIEKMLKEAGPKGLDLIIQVGDMGFGFPGVSPGVPSLIPPETKTVWIDGNHENYDLLYNRHKPNFGLDPYHNETLLGWRDFLDFWTYMPRGTIEDGILYIGGASSIDKRARTRGLDWWPQEDISYGEMEEILSTIDVYGPDKIHTIISHDCPSSFEMQSILDGPEKICSNRKFLEHVRKVVRPERWFFGHYHASFEGLFERCYFRCVNEVGSKFGPDFAIFNV